MTIGETAPTATGAGAAPETGGAGGDMLAALSRAAASGRSVVIAVGTFGLVHAGTVAFLRRAGQGCEALYVGILPESDLPEDCRKAADLMRSDERRRILAAMEGVAGADFVDGAEPCCGAGVSPASGADCRRDARTTTSLETWRKAAPEARWTAWADEESESGAAAQRLERAGVRPQWIRVGAGLCTTREVLGRIAR